MEDKKRNTILITDDEPMNIRALSHILSPEYDIFVEKDGQGCIDTARASQPDLILLDVIMPALSGFETIVTLKQEAQTQDIPVIFVTGLSNPQDEETGFNLGAADYINKPFSPAVVKLRVKNQLRIVNQMREIHSLSVTDVLTGIGNRRHFNTQLDQEWKRALRQQKPISFLVMDIDHFKKYNDTYGHLQGDIILKSVAGLIKDGVARPTDITARWGGEEFAVILPDTPFSGAMIVAENLRKKIEEASFELAVGDKTLDTHVTISIGVHSLIPEMDGGGCTLDKFVSDTDKALYHAKQTGRNKVCAVIDLPEVKE